MAHDLGRYTLSVISDVIDFFRCEQLATLIFATFLEQTFLATRKGEEIKLFEGQQKNCETATHTSS